jgi:hypothetical protein
MMAVVKFANETLQNPENCFDYIIKQEAITKMYTLVFTSAIFCFIVDA